MFLISQPSAYDRILISTWLNFDDSSELTALSQPYIIYSFRQLSRSLSHQAKHAEYVVCKPLSTDHNTNHNLISKLPAQQQHSHNYLNMFASKLTLAVFTACAAFAKGQGNSTIVDIAVENGSFTTLVAAVTAAGLAETLSGDGPFTVLGKIYFILFAHTDLILFVNLLLTILFSCVTLLIFFSPK